MTRIAFIGLGNMGGGMAARQVVGGREVHAFDLSEAAVKNGLQRGRDGGGQRRQGGREGGRGDHHAAGRTARRGRSMTEHILPHAPKSALLIDCSTIDVDSARGGGGAGEGGGVPIRGCAGVGRHGGGGCRDAGLHGRAAMRRRLRSVEEALKPMARVAIRAGDHGAGQAAKICNNMLLGHFDDRDVRGVCAGREAGAARRPVLRDRVEVLGSVLVAYNLRALAWALARRRRPTASMRAGLRRR